MSSLANYQKLYGHQSSCSHSKEAVLTEPIYCLNSGKISNMHCSKSDAYRSAQWRMNSNTPIARGWLDKSLFHQQFIPIKLLNKFFTDEYFTTETLAQSMVYIWSKTTCLYLIRDDEGMYRETSLQSLFPQ